MTTLYLSRLALSLRHRRVQHDIVDCYAMHQRILSGFPDVSAGEHTREQFGVLYRVEQGREGPLVLVQSRVMPDWGRLSDGYLAQPALVKQIDQSYATVQEGMTLAFRLRANAAKRISNRNTEQSEQWRGKRVELRGEEDQLNWLTRKGTEAGFRLVAVRARPGLNDEAGASRRLPQEAGDVRVGMGNVVHGALREGDTGQRKLTFGATTFDGRLVVTDAERFRRALEVGIGSGKAFGFGLLSVAPAQVLE